MRGRMIVVAALLSGVLALSSCATASTEVRDATAGAASATPSAPAPTGEASQAEEEEEPAEPVAPVDGAYVDYSDGIIERTVGPKVLFFHASWCTQCRKLDEQIRAEGAPDGLTVFKVDYDSRSDLRQKYGVTLQTTVVFVDDAGELISRSVLYEDPSIASLVAAMPQ